MSLSLGKIINKQLAHSYEWAICNLQFYKKCDIIYIEKMKEEKEMKVVYRAFDGTEFDNEPACKSYEYTKIRKSIVMLDCNGDTAPTPAQAALVWLKDEDANETFHAIAKECGDEEAANTISKYDTGVFYWDEGLEEYRCLSRDILDNITKLRNAVYAVGGSM